MTLNSFDHLTELVRACRSRNADVFTDPDYLRAALFTIEELNEAVNAYESYAGSEFLRSPDRVARATTSSREHVMLELGQALFMLVSTANQMGITDLDECISLAIGKIDYRCALKRNAIPT